MFRAFAILAAVTALFAGRAVAAQENCKLATLGTADAVLARDGRTLALKDGRELRLAAIEVVEASRAALQTLAAGHALRLEKLGAERDRYGRLVALAFIGADPQSLQQLLLSEGVARVSAHIGDKTCAAALFAAERAAREAKRGLWADPNFAPLQSDDLLKLRAEAGRFTLVEGKVLSVRVSGSTIYLNFGRRWTRDFSVFIPKRRERDFTAAGVIPKGLEGHGVRVRGWIDQRGGPIIEADAPEQIELID